MVITGAAAALRSRAPQRVRGLVYFDAMRQRVRELPGWQVVEMATGHCPMVTQPEPLVRHLLAFAAA